VSPGGAFASGGGFEVEPAAIAAGSGPLTSASDASSFLASTAHLNGGAAADAAGGLDPLAGALEQLATKVNATSGQLAVALSEAGVVLEMIAKAYVDSDQPLAGAP